MLDWARGLPADVRELIKAEFTSKRIDDRRRDERDDLLRQLGQTKIGTDLPEKDWQRELARQVKQAVDHYAGGRWKFDRDADQPHNPKNALLHKIMRANGGKSPSFSTVRRALTLN